MAADKFKKHLEHRRALKARKPTFTKQDTHKKKGIAQKWSFPRGIDSKMRLHLRGYKRMVTVGWKSPTSVRGLDRSGLLPHVVCNVAEIAKLVSGKDGIIVSGKVGMKTRISILKAAQEKNIKVLNIKDTDKFVSEAEKKFADKKKGKAEKEAEKKKKEKDAQEKKKAKEDKAAEAKETKETKELSPAEKEKAEEEKEDAERKEHEKVLIKKDM
jgi:large subunit ribosomal protein L32e